MKILAAIDLSPASDKVLMAAKEYAGIASAEIWLLHVADPDPSFVGYEAGPQTVRDQMAHKFREEHDRLQLQAENMRAAAIKTTALLVQGPFSDTILNEARTLGVDMILIGSHGHGKLYQMLVGSVSEAVIRGATCPVLVIPTRESA